MQNSMSGMTLRNARAYIQWWFTKHNVSAKQARNVPITFNRLYLDYEEFVRAARSAGEFNGKALPKDSILLAMQLYIHETIKAERAASLEPFRCTAPDATAVETWVKAITGATKPLDIAVMQHWIWMVKRKSYGLPVKHHLMPILFGAQGSGKTLGILALIKPYKDFLMNIKMDHLEDAKNYQGMEDNYIIFFDELQKIQRTDMEVLKHQITGEENTYRPLYTNSAINVKQNCSFIGATNKPFDESFTDTTGNRRFYEIKTLKRCDWETINTMDCLAMWLGTDERREHGYLVDEHLVTIAAVQQAMTRVDDAEQYILDRNLMPDGGATWLITLQDLYDDYSVWCSRRGMKAWDYAYFARKIRNQGLEVRDERTNKKRHKHVVISVDCDTILDKNAKLKVEKI